MTFDDLWQTLPIPAGYAQMDAVEQRRWQALVEAAFRSGLIDHAYSKRIRELESLVKTLKSELRDIGKALDDPRADLTMTASEVIKEMRSSLRVIHTWCCFPESFDLEQTKWLCMSSLGREQ
jgi:hypothetical protein